MNPYNTLNLYAAGDMMVSATEWLRSAVIYQIFPPSFQDSNGDGIGDLQGVIHRLGYIQRLGATVLWLNPCFDSPFGDAGYDVRDFYKVSPRYGTEADLCQLFEQAHRQGMKVLLDLVAGHTSMEHPWFKAEVADPKNPDSNRYIWLNRDFDPEEGPAKGDFCANFFWYQPALNYGWETPVEAWQDPVDAPGPQRNREELRRIMAYWFDRGCDGFRVDMAASLVKGGDQRGNRATVELWQEVRKWLDAHYPDRALIAEWSLPEVSIPAGFHLDFMMHFNAPGYPSLFFNGTGTLPPKEGPCYFDADGKGSLTLFRGEYQRQLEKTAGRGYICLPTANHDFQRLRCGPRGWEGLRPAWVFFMTQAGVPLIYYGEEIGMRFVPDTPSKEGSTLQGITAPNAGAPEGERAGTRTPMQWDDSFNAGFSSAPEEMLYLPLDPYPDRPAVAAQEEDTGSLLNFVRSLVALRNAHPALGAAGKITFLNPEGQSYPLVYERARDGSRYLIAVNPTRSLQQLNLYFSGADGQALLADGCELQYANGMLTVTVKPFGYGVFKV
ncbi:MAG: alpha-amylase family glycosyl hydrolase [Kiritimatiellales bacterium]